MSDMSQFCKRQPAACEVGGQAATVIGQRAQDGARKLYQIITDKRRSDHTGSIGGVENAERCGRRHGAARHPDAGRSAGGMARRADAMTAGKARHFAIAELAFDRPRSYIWLWDRARDTMTTIDEIRDNFALLDDWDDRYRYVIELGRTLDPMPEAEHSAANKVQGCASQVWLSKQIDRSDGGEPVLNYLGDSDAHIVRGLIAILLTLYSGHTPQQILATDASRCSTNSDFANI